MDKKLATVVILVLAGALVFSVGYLRWYLDPMRTPVTEACEVIRNDPPGEAWEGPTDDTETDVEACIRLHNIIHSNDQANNQN